MLDNMRQHRFRTKIKIKFSQYRLTSACVSTQMLVVMHISFKSFLRTYVAVKWFKRNLLHNPDLSTHACTCKSPGGLTEINKGSNPQLSHVVQRFKQRLSYVLVACHPACDVSCFSWMCWFFWDAMIFCNNFARWLQKIVATSQMRCVGFSGMTKESSNMWCDAMVFRDAMSWCF